MNLAKALGMRNGPIGKRRPCMDLAEALCIRNIPFEKEAAVDKVELNLAKALYKTFCIRESSSVKR